MIAHSAASRIIAEDSVTRDGLGLQFDDAWQSFARVCPHSFWFVNVDTDFHNRPLRLCRNGKSKSQHKLYVLYYSFPHPATVASTGPMGFVMALWYFRTRLTYTAHTQRQEMSNYFYRPSLTKTSFRGSAWRTTPTSQYSTIWRQTLQRQSVSPERCPPSPHTKATDPSSWPKATPGRRSET